MEDSSPSIKELVKALITVRLKIVGYKKSSAVTGRVSYAYATLEDIYNSCLEALLANGIYVEHHATIIEGKTALITRLIHAESEQWIRDVRFIINERGGNQGEGAGVTYAQKCALRCLLALEEADNDCQDETEYLNKNKLDSHEKETIYNKIKEKIPLEGNVEKTKKERYDLLTRACKILNYCSIEQISKDDYQKILEVIDNE